MLWLVLFQIIFLAENQKHALDLRKAAMVSFRHQHLPVRETNSRLQTPFRSHFSVPVHFEVESVADYFLSFFFLFSLSFFRVLLCPRP